MPNIHSSKQSSAILRDLQTSWKASLHFFAPEKLALLSLLKETKISTNHKMIKL